MSWSSIREALPCRAYVIINPHGLMCSNPTDHAFALRLMAENVGGSLKKAKAKGYRIAHVEIREVSDAA
jgi:hypothetical protein